MPRTAFSVSRDLELASQDGLMKRAQAGATFERTAFRTSRLLDFMSEKELTAQIGHPRTVWPVVLLKELVDNALDACEEAGTAPVVEVTLADDEIVVQDNGPGIPPDVVEGVLDFAVRVSSREAYVSPTRGAQGNALKVVVAMPFVLDGQSGRVVIEARGLRHLIDVGVDRIHQEPTIAHRTEPSEIENGTQITLPWPVGFLFDETRVHEQTDASLQGGPPVVVSVDGAGQI